MPTVRNRPDVLTPPSRQTNSTPAPTNETTKTNQGPQAPLAEGWDRVGGFDRGTATRRDYGIGAGGVQELIPLQNRVLRSDAPQGVNGDIGYQGANDAYAGRLEGGGYGAGAETEHMVGVEGTWRADYDGYVIDTDGGFDVAAEVGVDASGDIAARFDRGGVALGAGVNAFAGARATADYQRDFSLAGHDALRVAGAAEAYAGIGLRANGGAGFEEGRLRVHFELGASLGFGAGIRGDVTVNVAGIRQAVDDGVAAVTERVEAVLDVAAERVTNVIDSATREVSRVVDDVVASANRLVDETVASARRVVDEAVGSAQRMLDDATRSVTSTVQGAIADVTNTVDRVTVRATETYTAATRAARRAFSRVTSFFW